MVSQISTWPEHLLLGLIDADEADSHRRVWNKRNALYKAVDKSVHDLVIDVNVILEGVTPAEAIPATATGTTERFSF